MFSFMSTILSVRRDEFIMITTLCYMERNNKFLMLHRNKKEHDVNKGKWIGVGGKLEAGETPLAAVVREIREETGYIVQSCDFRGIVIFNYNDNPSEYMHLYTCKAFSGSLITCDEGELEWVDKEEVYKLNIWEGDRIFLDLIRTDCPFFYLSLNYKNDSLISHKLEFLSKNYVSFEVFIPDEYIEPIISEFRKYGILNEGGYDDVYAVADVEGHWSSLKGAKPFEGEIGIHSTVKEKLIKFRVKEEFKELAYCIVKKLHPYEKPVINMYHLI